MDDTAVVNVTLPVSRCPSRGASAANVEHMMIDEF